MHPSDRGMKYAHAITEQIARLCPEDGHSLSYGNVTSRFEGKIGVDNDAGCSLIVGQGQGRVLNSKNSSYLRATG